MYGTRSNDLQKYCEQQKCQKQVQYNKIKTSTNDVTINCRMKYAQYVNAATGSSGGTCTKELLANGKFR
jgi:hypothetical protein